MKKSEPIKLFPFVLYFVCLARSGNIEQKRRRETKMNSPTKDKSKFILLELVLAESNRGTVWIACLCRPLSVGAKLSGPKAEAEVSPGTHANCLLKVSFNVLMLEQVFCLLHKAQVAPRWAFQGPDKANLREILIRVRGTKSANIQTSRLIKSLSLHRRQRQRQQQHPTLPNRPLKAICANNNGPTDTPNSIYHLK